MTKHLSIFFNISFIEPKEPCEGINKCGPVAVLLLLPYNLVIFGVPPHPVKAILGVQWGHSKTHGWLISQGITLRAY